MIPASSASRGLWGAKTSLPSLMAPPSDWCTPAKIFMRVDLPAPFSPTTPSTSPSSSERDTSLRTGTPRNALETRSISRRCGNAPPRPFESLSPSAFGHLIGPEAVGLHFRAVDILLGQKDMRPEFVLRDLRLVAVEILIHVFDRLARHGQRVLRHRRVQIALADRGQRLLGPIDTDDDDVLGVVHRHIFARLADGAQRANGVVVIAVEHRVDLRIRRHDL